MKPTRAVLISLMMAMALAITADAFARGKGHGGGHAHGNHKHGGHAHFGVVISAPGWWYYPPYYPFYPPPAEAELPGPVRYIEQSAAPEESGEYWYYCAEAGDYYPNVTGCPAGWRQIVPAPPN
jgi:hypothetical protein